MRHHVPGPAAGCLAIPGLIEIIAIVMHLEYILKPLLPYGALTGG
jgi:hypothetical protein